jgi:hypothetical protein
MGGPQHHARPRAALGPLRALLANEGHTGTSGRRALDPGN